MAASVSQRRSATTDSSPNLFTPALAHLFRALAISSVHQLRHVLRRGIGQQSLTSVFKLRRRRRRARRSKLTGVHRFQRNIAVIFVQQITDCQGIAV
jgi:hypothetical protein